MTMRQRRQAQYAADGSELPQTHPRLKALQVALLQWVVASEKPVAWFQRLCGVVPLKLEKAKHEERPETPSTHSQIEHLPGDAGDVQRGTYTYAPLHGCFWVFACMGDELGYIVLFPFIFWCIDFMVGRRMVFAWICLYYVGQALKDVLQQPRPRPPVVQLEDHFATEFGFPSVHSVGAVGLLLHMAHLFDQQDETGDASNVQMRFYVATVTWIMICFSRAYMGVHSLLDIVAGMLIGWGGRLVIEAGLGSWIDDVVMSGQPLFPLLHLLFWVFMLWAYPRPPFYTSAFGTCCLVVGAGVGVLQASWLRVVFRSFFGEWPLCNSMVGRMMVGSLAIAVTRLTVKPICHTVLMAVLPPTRAGHKFTQRYEVDGPTKFVTYACVGLVAVLVAPKLFVFFGV